ncbi:twin-arginine translocation signal domain-containing protein [Thiogranum longum]
MFERGDSGSDRRGGRSDPHVDEESMMKRKPESVSEPRREFLKDSAAVGTLIAVASAAPGQAMAEEIDTPNTEGSKGYHLTRHILEYYKSAAR